MGLRRGFKAEAETIALDQRAEMKLAATARLDPIALAIILAIPIVTFAQCASALDNDAQRTLRALHQSVCALTVFEGHKRIIVYNDQNALTRQVSDLAHELSHTILEHEPTPLGHQFRYAERDVAIEEEANYLAGALLVPRSGALDLMRDGMCEEELAEHYGVSIQMGRWRVRGTGVKYQLARSANLRNRRK